MGLHELGIMLLGDLPREFTFLYGIFDLLFIVALLIMCLFPIVFIFKLFK